SGELRVLFLYRPKNEIPYFRLEDHLQNDVVVDTTINLQAGEVYTLHVLQKEFATNRIGTLLRQENFHKIPLSDSLVYVNFYNYSASGFAEADESLKPTIRGQLNQAGISEEANVF